MLAIEANGHPIHNLPWTTVILIRQQSGKARLPLGHPNQVINVQLYIRNSVLFDVQLYILDSALA